jgi:hypothetical protein
MALTMGLGNTSVVDTVAIPQIAMGEQVANLAFAVWLHGAQMHLGVSGSRRSAAYRQEFRGCGRHSATPPK